MATRLVIGGARSGKSRFAESLLAGAPAVEYVATSDPRADDAEWVERVAVHVARRPPTWSTTETLDLPAVLARADAMPVLVDCLTVWLTRVMDAAGAWRELPGHDPDAAAAVEARVVDLVAALRGTGREVVMVTNEVGQGIVPATASGRLFRDTMGVLNARVAAVCDEVWLVVAGLPLRLA